MKDVLMVFLVFEKESDVFFSEEIIVEFEFDPASTATNGVDFSTIPNPVVIPPGQMSVQIPFTVFDDGITEGLETVIIVLESACSCSGSFIEIQIDDAIPMLSAPEDVSFCNEAQGTISPNVSGGGTRLSVCLEYRLYKPGTRYNGYNHGPNLYGNRNGQL